MGLPLPSSTQYKVQHSQQTGDDDWTRLTPQDIMARQWAAYEGLFKHPLRKTDPREIDHNVIVNRCEPIVSTGVDLLLGDEVKFEVMQGSGLGKGANPDSPDLVDEDAQAYLDAVFEAQPLGKMPTLASDAINGAVFGHHFLNLIPNDPDTDPYPGLAVMNPHQMRVETDPADYRKCLSYDFRWDDFDEEQHPIERRKLVVRDKEGGGWTIHEQERSNAATQNMLGEPRPSIDPLGGGWGEPEAPITWQYPWSPIHDGPNMVQPNIYWGKADLRLDLIHLNDVLNFNLSNLNRIIYFNAHPRDVFFGIRGDLIEVSPNNSVAIPSKDARVQRLELTSDLAAIANHVDRLMESMDEESHIPSVAVGRLRNLPAIPSGVALKVAMNPAIMQTGSKRQLYGLYYTKLCQHILELGGYGANRKIVIHWAELLPVDDYQEAQTAVLYHGLGASRDTLLQRGGFDPDVESEKRDEEDAADAEAGARRFASSGLPQQGADEQGQGMSPAGLAGGGAVPPSGSGTPLASPGPTGPQQQPVTAGGR